MKSLKIISLLLLLITETNAQSLFSISGVSWITDGKHMITMEHSDFGYAIQKRLLTDLSLNSRSFTNDTDNKYFVMDATKDCKYVAVVKEIPLIENGIISTTKYGKVRYEPDVIYVYDFDAGKIIKTIQISSYYNPERYQDKQLTVFFDDNNDLYFSGGITKIFKYEFDVDKTIEIDKGNNVGVFTYNDMGLILIKTKNVVNSSKDVTYFVDYLYVDGMPTTKVKQNMIKQYWYRGEKIGEEFWKNKTKLKEKLVNEFGKPRKIYKLSTDVYCFLYQGKNQTGYYWNTILYKD